ncbi:MAG: EF-hand domain-containing protein [Hyphomonadaceae bacterium]
MRELFPPPQKQQQNVPGAGQQMPGAASKTTMTGVGGAQMSSDMLMQLLSMQGSRPSTTDAATRMISSLDTDGDGALSLSEASAAGASRASEAFVVLDTDGDGVLTSDELATSLEAMGPPPGGPPPGGPPPGGPPPGGGPSDLASRILSEVDSDQDGGISLSELTSATGAEENDTTTSAFSSLDTDGDGKLSLAELTAALDKYLQTDASRFASNAEDAIAA